MKDIFTFTSLQLAFQFKFWRLDAWIGSSYFLLFDEVEAYSDNPNLSSGTQICGSSPFGQIYSINSEILHNTYKLTIFSKNFFNIFELYLVLQIQLLIIRLYKDINKDMDCSISAIITFQSLQLAASWGISDFTVFILKCSNGCHSCDFNGVCLIWKRVLTYFSNITITGGEGWKNNNFVYHGVESCGIFIIMENF